LTDDYIVLLQYTRLIDRQTDGRTDKQISTARVCSNRVGCALIKCMKNLTNRKRLFAAWILFFLYRKSAKLGSPSVSGISHEGLYVRG